MNETSEGQRRQLLDELRRVVAAARLIAGVCRIAVLGSIVTTKPNPKDIDVLVVVADDADLTALATCARRLQGQAQSFNRGADVFLADEQPKVERRVKLPADVEEMVAALEHAVTLDG
jgi:predicted nucleotidyltransferase